MHVCLLGKEFGLANAIARALGADYETRHRDDFNLNYWSDWQEWCDVVLLDLRPSLSQAKFAPGLQLMDEIQKTATPPPVIVYCQENDAKSETQVMEHGAYEIITGGINIAALRQILRRAHNAHAAVRELESLRASALITGRLHQLIGTSPGMLELFAQAQKIAPCDVNVLITGETGTGKELLARAIHQMSARGSRPMVAFACTNLPDTLIEDELFGHEKGAFTGALANRRGRFESADQSTLFLDEIGDLSLGLQPKLLRVLQERSLERLGSNATVDINVRLITATNRNLAEMVKSREFREDLYYRVNVVQLHIPPLRDRRDDVPLLAHHFLQISAKQFNKNIKRFSQRALRALDEHSWPGNVRELENAVQRAAALCEGQSIELWHLPSTLRNTVEDPPPEKTYELEVRQFKRRLIVRTLQQCGWSKAESARTLGVARGYLHRLINQLEIHEGEEDSIARLAQQHLPPSKQVM
jgi:DNA-binding NtrC family response regulator